MHHLNENILVTDVDIQGRGRGDFNRILSSVGPSRLKSSAICSSWFHLCFLNITVLQSVPVNLSDLHDVFILALKPRSILQRFTTYLLERQESLDGSRGEFRPRQTRQLPRAVDLKGRLLSCQSY